MHVSDTETSEEKTSQTDQKPQNPAILADISSSFTYASYQNAIPVIRSISINNDSNRHIEKIRLELTSSPTFLRPKSWTLDRLVPGDRLPLSDRKVDLDAGYLAGLNEAERGEITLRLTSAGELLDEQRIPVRLLARDEWGGVNDMAQLLPAFVMPNDPGVAPILRATAERLIAHGHPGGLDGYQSNNPQRAFMLTAAIYSAVAGMALHYAEPPASFESRGQKVRRPGTIAEERLATCLDTSLLFAAALEAAGLHPVILMFDGHAAVGVWLGKRTFPNAIETDPMEVRKALASRELISFETTGVTHRPAMTLEAAQRAIAPRLDEEEAHTFVSAIDVRRSRSGGITPLASHEPARRNVADEETAPVVELPLPAAPTFGDLPTETVEQKPTTAAGRIDRWQKKLLDLTLRNRLLNFPDSKKTIPFLCTDVAYLEDRLADGAAIRIISLPDQNPLGERDPALYRDVHGKDLQRNFAAEALSRDELPSLLDGRQLEARLIDLHRQVRNDFAEGGANTLFLAVGFLRWKKKPEDERSYRAPLLLVPVKLERRSASSRFSIRFHEDEPRFNATLLQFLERDFDLKLSQFSGDLPLDDSGVDVPRILSMMRQAVRDVPGMEVVDETALSTFSFAKFLMWKDLVERTDALRQNRIVRHLIDTPDQAFDAGGQAAPFRDEYEIDRTCAPCDIICLLPADSSQTAASLAAAEGRDFVIVGPPGTGKSQTIANMIANCLAVGKTVLFVAEKTAALDVVYRRLREHGLGHHCIELHSSKTDRRHFLGQLKSAWEHGRKADLGEWISINERLRIRRDELNAYVDALHRRYPNGWTPYLALGTALRAADKPAPNVSWPERDAHDEDGLRKLEDLADELGQVFASIERRPVLDMVDIETWSSGWQEDLLMAARALQSAIDLMAAALDDYRVSLGLKPGGDASPAEMAALTKLADALQKSRGRNIAIAFDPELAKCHELMVNLERSIEAYREAEHGLSASYAPASVREVNIALLDQGWREANASFWPNSMLGKRKIRKLLQSYAETGRADPAREIPALRRMQELLADIDGSSLADKQLPIEGLITNIDTVRQTLELAQAVRDALNFPGQGPEELRLLVRAVAPCLSVRGADDVVRRMGDIFLNASETLQVARQQFQAAAGRTDDPTQSEYSLGTLKEQIAALLNARHLLRDWSAWCRVRRQAVAYNLADLVEQIETGAILPDEARAAFRAGYARWWLRLVLDGDPVLRDFRRFQHEHAIEDFREIDDLVRAHAAQRVSSAISHGLPAVQSVPRNSELGLLRHQMELQRPSQSIRDMIGRMPESFGKLAPCMLMSPLSIAQYLPPNQALFDVVIFDEASQITTWDAVGAIARARQTIIVGDPKQLPPTNFFGRNEEDEDVADHEKDLESILDEAKAAGIPVRDLRWHYRSRSESLIAFSNHHYYQNRLVTFPSPAVEDRAVHLHKVPDGVYDRGKSRTNRIEAEAVVQEAVSRMKGWLRLAEEQRPTLGVITFNAQQQSLIMDLLDAARRQEPELEWFFAEDRIEPAIVKNLENVQGDERDVILFSITFWKDAAGKLTMDFGALNRDGGERRLNVAVTRARQELIVFSGFTADQIDPTRTKALAVQHLKAFLDYAERGASALPAQDIGSVGGFDSPFEEAVAAQLEQRGWLVVPQVGISGFRIDLGVRHPDLPGAYLAGVECDGATYHGSATARDRDKVREQVLTGLGWNILRVWSTDWWFDAMGCAERLHADLEALLKDSRARKAAESDAAQSGATAIHWDMGHKVDALPGPAADKAEPVSEDSPTAGGLPVDSLPPSEAIVPKPASLDIADPIPLAHADTPSVTDPGDHVEGCYRITDLSGFSVSPDKFHDFEYAGTLRSMVDAIIETESPLRRDILAHRISRAHGWLRTGSRIRDTIDRHLQVFDTTIETSGEFIWKKGAVSEILPYRAPANDDARRSVADIPLAELASVILDHPGLLDEPDSARELARLLGVERLAAVSRTRLEEAIARARSHVVVEKKS
jgi:very-short-patch-repair endonuclease/RecA/RadA recombinase